MIVQFMKMNFHTHASGTLVKKRLTTVVDVDKKCFDPIVYFCLFVIKLQICNFNKQETKIT